MEDGEIQEDVSGATYRPALEWQDEASSSDATWAQQPLAGPSTAAYAPIVPGYTSQDYLVDPRCGSYACCPQRRKS